MAYRTQNFQPLNLAQVSPFGYGLSQLGSGINKGAELYNQILDSQLNKFAIEQKKAEEPYYGQMAQAAAQLAQLKPSELQSKIGLQNQQAKNIAFQLDNPLYGQPGVAGQLGAEELIKKHPELSHDPNALQSIQQQIKLNQLGKAAQIDLIQKHAEGYNWSQLPAETRNGLVAQGLGMGVDPLKLEKYVNQGMSIKDIAEKEGLDPDNLPSPRYFPTTATKTRTQQVEQIGAELDYISSSTTPIISKYANTFGGVSKDKLKDMFSSDPEAQKRFGQYIGALALQNELTAGRITLSGARSGVELTRMLTEKSLAGIDKFSPIKMSDIAFKEAQKTIDRVVQRGAKIRSMTGMSPFSQNSNAIRQNMDVSNLSDEELMNIVNGE